MVLDNWSIYLLNCFQKTEFKPLHSFCYYQGSLLIINEKGTPLLLVQPLADHQ